LESEDLETNLYINNDSGVKMKNKKETVMSWKRIVIICFIFIFVSFGIFFVSTLFHEAIHVFMSDGNANKVCLDFNSKINDSVQAGFLIAHTEFNSNFTQVSSFKTWREYSEKTALIFQYVFCILLSLSIGAFLGLLYRKKVH